MTKEQHEMVITETGSGIFMEPDIVLTWAEKLSNNCKQTKKELEVILHVIKASALLKDGLCNIVKVRLQHSRLGIQYSNIKCSKLLDTVLPYLKD